MSDTRYTSLSRTHERLEKAGYEGGTLDKNKYEPEADYPEDVTDQFNAGAAPLDILEEDFKRHYERQKLYADNNVAYTDSRRITVDDMEELNAKGPEGRHPTIEDAYQDIMSRPEKFGFKVEKNNMIEQAMGQGPHDFTPLEP